MNKWKLITIVGIATGLVLACERRSQPTAVRGESGADREAPQVAAAEPLFLRQQGVAFRSLSIYEDFQGHGRTVTANYETKLDLYRELPALAAEAQRVFSEGVRQEAERVGARYAIVSPNRSDLKEGRVVTGFAFERSTSGTWSNVVVPGKVTQ